MTQNSLFSQMHPLQRKYVMAYDKDVIHIIDIESVHILESHAECHSIQSLCMIENNIYILHGASNMSMSKLTLPFNITMSTTLSTPPTTTSSASEESSTSLLNSSSGIAIPSNDTLPQNTGNYYLFYFHIFHLCICEKYYENFFTEN